MANANRPTSAERETLRAILGVANAFEVCLVALRYGYVQHGLMKDYLIEVYSWFYGYIAEIAIYQRLNGSPKAYIDLEKYYFAYLKYPKFSEAHKYVQERQV